MAKIAWRKHMVSFLAAACTCISGFGVSAENASVTPEAQGTNVGSSLDTGYQAYLQQHGGAGFNGHTVVLDAESASGSEGTVLEENVEGRRGKSLLTQADGYAEWTVEIPEDGLYAMQLEYCPLEGIGGVIQRSVKIDGELPFDEAEPVEFSRVFRDEEPLVHLDGKNDVRPAQVEVVRWMKADVRDAQGYFDERLLFYLSKGPHQIRLESLAEPMAIGGVTLVSESGAAESYETVRKGWESQGAQEVQGVLTDGILVLQAEEAYEKSDQTLYPVVDQSSPLNQPYDYIKQKLNSIGGTKWQNPGQWISWQVEVPESGFYEIGYRFRQNYVRDITPTRTLYIDGELPFQEADELTFPYNYNWTVQTAGGETPYLFYLEEGPHTITLEVDLGEVADSLMLAMESLRALNEANWELLTIIGNEPDLYRDYNFDEYCPGVLQVFQEQAKQLEEIANQWIEMTGKQDSNVAQIQLLVYQLNEMWEDPDTIAGLYLSFKDNVSNFANLIMNASQQPVALDYLFLAEPGAELPRANASFFFSVKYGFLKFLATFFNDYNTLSDPSEAQPDAQPVRVWIGNGLSGGRDQAIELNTLASQDFTSKTGIPVRLEIVPPANILTATVAGEGPDVALQVSGSDPVNYAMRGAVVDLSQLEGFDELRGRFCEQAFVPYTFLGGIYALPETFSFPMMFYRKDILERLGLRIEDIQTWGDLIAILPILQRQNMNISMPANYNSYYMFLLQMGGEVYRNGGKASNLDSKVALDAFSYWMDFYTNYNLPISYNFVTRFRTGEIPIGIEDYTQYNTLKLAAPEIEGQWEMTAIPGIENEDGTINNVAALSGAGCILLSAGTNQENAWKFMQWYTSGDVQYTFGNQLESVMGVGARYNTANLEAFERLPWQISQRRALLEQIDHLAGIPEVPGGYMTTRNIGFAMNTTYNTSADARKTLLSYVDQINQEIQLKREEFGLDTQ